MVVEPSHCTFCQELSQTTAQNIDRGDTRILYVLDYNVSFLLYFFLLYFMYFLLLSTSVILRSMWLFHGLWLDTKQKKNPSLSVIKSISYKNTLLEDETGDMLVKYTRLHSFKQNFLYKKISWKKEETYLRYSCIIYPKLKYSPDYQVLRGH